MMNILYRMREICCLSANSCDVNSPNDGSQRAVPNNGGHEYFPNNNLSNENEEVEDIMPLLENQNESGNTDIENPNLPILEEISRQQRRTPNCDIFCTAQISFKVILNTSVTSIGTAFGVHKLSNIITSGQKISLYDKSGLSVLIALIEDFILREMFWKFLHQRCCPNLHYSRDVIIFRFNHDVDNEPNKISIRSSRSCKDYLIVYMKYYGVKSLVVFGLALIGHELDSQLKHNNTTIYNDILVSSLVTLLPNLLIEIFKFFNYFPSWWL